MLQRGLLHLLDREIGTGNGVYVGKSLQHTQFFKVCVAGQLP